MKNILFIADFFLSDGILGGAELYNENLLRYLCNKYRVQKINSHNVTKEVVFKNKNNFFIISNFMNLSQVAKNKIQDLNIEYVILEHDHKYVSTNDPSKFVNMLAPRNKIINFDFFHKAKAVLCQSKIHSETLQKNLLLDTVVNLSCNLWSDEQIDLLVKNSNNQKKHKFAYLESTNKNKGTPAAKFYCKKNSIDALAIKHMPQDKFYNTLSQVENLIFFPQWLESFNRLAVEAKLLGCKIITNKLLGVSSEAWFRNSTPLELPSILKDKRAKVFDTFDKIINDQKIDSLFIENISIPKISIITSLYKGSKFIDNFMKNIVSQTFFNKCELIILDANSPDKEYEDCIQKYENIYSNIKYKKLKERLGVQETMNLAVKYSTGQFLTIANVDDLRNTNHIEFLAKLLTVNDNADLVYAGCYEAVDIVPHDQVNGFQSSQLYEHSTYEFSKQNMIKCLPGPMPMWRKSIHKTVGDFDKNLKYAADWDFWLRAVRSGSKFLKFEKIMGIYYNNPKGLSTSKDNALERFQEERLVFNKNKDVFGNLVSGQFEQYFNEK